MPDEGNVIIAFALRAFPAQGNAGTGCMMKRLSLGSCVGMPGGDCRRTESTE